MNSGRNLSRTSAFPASAAQQRLWFLQKRHPDSRAYTDVQTIWLQGPLDADVLERAIGDLVERHGQLRAVFELGDDGLVQRELPAGALPLERHAVDRVDLDGWLAGQLERGFDLEHGPPMRAALADLGGDDRLLALFVHHLVTDGWSGALFFEELGVGVPG